MFRKLFILSLMITSLFSQVRELTDENFGRATSRGLVAVEFWATWNEANKVSILGYDALGLIYYCWFNNNFQFRKDQLYNKEGFKGRHGEFIIENNLSKQKLKIYKVSEKKFIKVY